jgi:hypothetical protein
MNEFSDYLKHIKILLKDFRNAVEPYLDENKLKDQQNKLKLIDNTIAEYNQSNEKVPKESTEFRSDLIYEIKLANDAITAHYQFIDLLNSYLMLPIPSSHSEQETLPELPIQEFPQVSEPEGNFTAINQDSIQSGSSGLSKENAGLKKAEITLSDIIEAKIIPPGTVILKEFRGNICRGIITEDGKITLKGFNKATFNDPHSAVKAITDLPLDGWKWWNVFIGFWKRPLDDLREIYLKGIS